MIKKLKRKLIILATVSMLILMTVLISVMNLINFSTVTREADDVLSVLSHPDLPFRDGTDLPGGEPMLKPEAKREMGDFLPPGMSPEVPYESRFFSAKITQDGQILETNVERIISVDSETVETYVSKAQADRRDRGFVGAFRFAKFSDGESTRIVFLDCGRRLDAFYHFLRTSVAIGLVGCAVVFLLFLLVANWIVRPIAESYEKQKRFITDAGHEIKTPLTVIAANVDLLEADIGENECLSDIREETARLSSLTGDLVSLSRMEEEEGAILKTDFPVSDLITEEANTFRAPITAQKKTLSVQVSPNLSMNGSPGAIRQLISILLDNALKYSPEGGSIALSLTSSKKELLLSVFNTTKEVMREEELPRLFDRFYRTDTSRNSETGGHGIGLSIARAITDAHGGKITASTKSGNEFTVTVTLPM